MSLKDQWLKDQERRHHMLIRTGIFRRLESHVASALMGQLQPIDFAAGQVVFAQGDRGHRLYIIVSGKVKMSYRSRHGQENLVTIMGPSDMFGEVSIFDHGTRIYSATAVTEVHALSMGRDTMQAWIADHPEIAEQMLRVLARRLQLMTDNLNDMIFTDVPTRVAGRLLQLAQRFGRQEDDAVRVTHDLTTQEIAQLAGACTATVDRVLSGFADRGWIRLEGTSLIISDAESLAALLCAETLGVNDA